jgi:hypothetical protein
MMAAYLAGMLGFTTHFGIVLMDRGGVGGSINSACTMFVLQEPRCPALYSQH